VAGCIARECDQCASGGPSILSRLVPVRQPAWLILAKLSKTMFVGVCQAICIRLKMIDRIFSLTDGLAAVGTQRWSLIGIPSIWRKTSQ